MNPWYTQLTRPPLTPPNWIFGPVWTVLYVMIAASIYIFVRKARPNISPAMGLMIVFHVMSNLIWTPLFFTLQSPGWALLDILFLDISLLFLILKFWPMSRLSSKLLWPYGVWVLFATYLNIGFFVLN
jgi:translocator protein